MGCLEKSTGKVSEYINRFILFTYHNLGGGFRYFLCSPRKLGKMDPIFFRWDGNHQPDEVCPPPRNLTWIRQNDGFKKTQISFQAGQFLGNVKSQGRAISSRILVQWKK